MKKIQPVLFWLNGQNKSANGFSLRIVGDNLENSCTFYYALLSAENESLAAGNLTISGDEYVAWGATEDVNLAAFEWACTKLNLTLA